MMATCTIQHTPPPGAQPDQATVMYAWLNGWLDAWLGGWMAGCMVGWLHDWMDGWMHT